MMRLVEHRVAVELLRREARIQQAVGARAELLAQRELPGARPAVHEQHRNAAPPLGHRDAPARHAYVEPAPGAARDD